MALAPAPARERILEAFARALGKGGASVTGVAYARARPPAPGPAQLQTAHRLTLVLDGSKHVLFADGREVVDRRLGRGSALVIPAFAWSMPRFDSARTIIGMVFNRAFIRFLYSEHDGRAPVGAPTAWFHTAAPPRRDTALAMQALAARARAATDAEADVALVRAVLALGREELARAVPEAATGPLATWQALCAHIQDHLDAEIGRAHLAAIFDIHPNHISRLFAAYGGESLGAYATRVRMERAAELLRATRAPIQEVARRCGFSDAGYFIRLFRRHHRAPPARWRRDGP